MTPLASCRPRGAVSWRVARVWNGQECSPVAALPVGATVEDCKRAVQFVAGHYLLRALDRAGRVIPRARPLLVVVTPKEADVHAWTTVAEAVVSLLRWFGEQPNRPAINWAWWTSSGAGPSPPPPQPSIRETPPAIPVEVTEAARRFGVSMPASEPALRARRRTLARVNHPDASDHRRATERMQAVNRDFETLLEWTRAEEKRSHP
jgi:hypothetical protein